MRSRTVCMLYQWQCPPSTPPPTPPYFTFYPTPLPRPSAAQVALSVSLMVLFLGLLPLWLCVAYWNRTTREVVFSGLQPVFSAMAISR